MPQTRSGLLRHAGIGTEYLTIEALGRAWKLGYTRVSVFDPTRNAVDYVTKRLEDNPDSYHFSRRLLH